jgi:tetratricopeptide (TPR) repeat protein
MKSMAKAPKDRYASVTDLAADVQHWIADEPVTAYREPWSESLRRWAVKYRSQSIGAVAGLLFAAVALATMLYMQTRHNHELQQALDSERLALTEASDQSRQAENAIERFYTGVTEDVMLRRPELTGLRAKLLQAALQFYLQRVQMLQEGWRGKRILDIEIENVAYGLGRIAAIQALLGDRQAAIESRKKQITIYESQPRQSSSRIPTAWNDLANLQRLAGKPKDALQSYRAALKAAKERMGGPSLALLQADMGRFLVDLGHTAEGQSLLEEALSTQRELTRKPSRENAYIQGNLAASAMTLGNMADGQNDWKQAEEYYRESVESLQKLRELLPRDKWTMAELARALNNLGLGQANLARDAEVGRAAVMEGLKIREEFYHDQPLNIEYRADLARSYYHLARIEAIKGDRDAALAAITKAQELYKDIPPKGPEDLFFQACLKAMRAQYVSTSESATLSDDAMMLLRRGIEQGYSNVSRLKNDSALESLRARPDFQGLIDLANQVSAGTE